MINQNQIFEENGQKFTMHVDKHARRTALILLSASALVFIAGEVWIALTEAACDTTGCVANMAGIVLPFYLFVVPVVFVVFIVGLVKLVGSRKKLPVIAVHEHQDSSVSQQTK